MFKKIAISICTVLIFGLNLAQAEVITFDDYLPLDTQNGDVVTHGFTFSGGDPGVWAEQSSPPGAFDGSPYLIFFPPMTFSETGGESFTLNSLQLGLSWYQDNNSATANIVSTLTGGGTSNMDVTLGHAFQTVNFGLDVTSVQISSLDSLGYFAMDNVSVNAGVPEPTTMLLLGLGLIGLAGVRRKLQN